MKKVLSKLLAAVLCLSMIFTIMPISASATIPGWDTGNVTYDSETFGTNGYYNVISQKEYTLVPGAATETEMVLNNASGNRRQVMHIIEVDPSNPDVSIVPGYYGIDTDLTDVNNWKTAGVTNVVKYYENNLGYNVVGAMNTSLAYDSNAPIDFLVYNGVNLSQGSHHAQTFLAVIKDPDTGEISCELHNYADGIPENCWQAVSANFGFTVKDGALVKTAEERTSAAAARSMIGIKEDGTLVLVMNDGRGANNSVGFCDYELGESMLALGCKWAVNCDGGGSSSFVTKRAGETTGTMRCVPCDGAERPTINSVMVVSNVGPTGELGSVNITSGYDYFAPGTTYTFGADAIDTHGYAMDMPADAVWTLSDAAFGSIENGAFVSNGTLGDVSIQVESNGTVVGSKTIHVANPTNLSLSASSTVLPYSTPEKPGYTTIPVVAKIGEADVYCGGAFSVALSDPDAATLDGFTIYSSEDTSKTGVVVTLTYLPTGETLTYTVSYGEGSQILWDFENGIDGWLGQQDAHDWQVAHGVTPFDEDTSVSNSLYTSEQMNASSRSKTFLSTRENGGQVHNGNCALGVEYDFRGADFNSWVYQILFNVLNENGDNPNCVLRDVENGKKATAIGMWLYLPVGFRDVKNAGSLALQMNLYYRKADGTEGQAGVNMQYNGKNINALTEEDIPDGRWIYVKGALPNQPYVALTDPMQSNFRAPSIFRMYVKPSIAQTLTYYYDDITLDYSSAVDDRDNPVITNPCYALNDTAIALENGASIDGTSIDFSANAVDFSASNMTGIDASSAAVYLDGVPASDAKYANGQITGGGFTLVEGEHTVIFEIKDNIGNISQLKRTFTCTNAANQGIYLAGHNDSGEAPEAGSVYYIDVKAENVENVRNAVATIDLQTANEWVADHMTVADGFEVTYDVNEAEPEFVTFHITNTGSTLSGDQTIVSIPVRVWDWDESWPFGGDGTAAGFGKAARYAKYGEPVLKVEANVTYGLLNESVPFGGSISVATKVNGNKTSGVWHTHDAELTVLNQAADCVHDGYTGRTYCETCASVVDWGETVAAVGHNYVLNDENKMACESCGELLNGEYEGKLYADGVVANGWLDGFYYADGVKITDCFYSIDGQMYQFEADGSSALYTGYVQDEGGWRYYSLGDMLKGFVAFADGTYYFRDDNGYAPVGEYQIGSRVYKFEGEKGKCLGAWADYTDDNGNTYKRYYYSLRYYQNQFREIDGELYYFNNLGYMQTGKRAIAHLGKFVGAYEFGEKGAANEGQYVGPLYGPFVDSLSGNTFIGMDLPGDTAPDGTDMLGGVVAVDCLAEYQGDYYLSGGKNAYMVTNKTMNLTAEQIGDYDFVPGEYRFGADGKLIFTNGPVLEDNGRYYDFFVNGRRVYEEGLYEFEGNYYYVRSNGLLATWPMVLTEDTANGLVEPGEYSFGSDGKMILTNGPVADIYNPNYLTFYKNGARVYDEGLYEYNGKYYYVRSNGLLLTWGMYIDKMGDTGLPAGEYQFNAAGELQLQSGPVPDAYNPKYLTFYKDGIRIYDEGLYEYEGKYYYVRSNGLLLTWGMYIDKMGDTGLPAGEYQFNAAGELQLQSGPVPDAYNPKYLTFYKDGIRIYDEGLYEYEGKYYYVRSNGLLLTWGMYIDKMGDTGLPAGEYQFNAAGELQLLNGPVPDAFNSNYLTFYKDGIRIYEEGLYEYNGGYYYVRSNGLLLTWGMNIDKMGDTGLPAGYYEFGPDGKML